MSDIKLERTPSIRLYICRLSWGLWLLMFPCFKLNNGGFPSILLSCCCTPELSILSAPRAADLADGHWVNLNKQRAYMEYMETENSRFFKNYYFCVKKKSHVWHFCAPYLYLDLKKCSPPLSDLQPVLLWTCCPWKRDVTHLRLHRFIPWQTLPGALQSPWLCAGFGASAVCNVKIPFLHFPYPGAYERDKISARRRRNRKKRSRRLVQNVRWQSDVQETNKASVPHRSRSCPMWLLQAA